MWLTPLILVTALLLFAGAVLALRARYPKNPQSLIELIDQQLPQTQCAQCGYPGCRPYAEAVAAGAPLNLCPPGGAEVYQQLQNLMGAEDEAAPPAQPAQAVAYVDESQCIGCALCLPPCPVDAIVGAPNKMHTVIAAECTGCELCIPACPVDCIELQPLPIAQPQPRAVRPSAAASRSCVNCGACNPVCPVELPAQELLHALQQGRIELAATLGLSDCIECGLCDRACPSHIDLARQFGAARVRQQHADDEARARTHYKDRFAAHEARLARQRAAAEDKRAQRLQSAGRWS